MEFRKHVVFLLFFKTTGMNEDKGLDVQIKEENDHNFFASPPPQSYSVTDVETSLFLEDV